MARIPAAVPRPSSPAPARTPAAIRATHTASYIAADGRQFMHHQLGRAYDNYLAQRGADAAQNAPGGPFSAAAIKQHGHIRSVTIDREGLGRHRITAQHVDGNKTTQVVPDAFRAHSLAGELLQIEPMPSAAVHQRSRQLPAGEREAATQKRFDHNEDPSEETL